MSDPRDHDRLPDPAALDELSRAFADDGPAGDGPDDEPDDGPDDAPNGGEPDDGPHRDEPTGDRPTGDRPDADAGTPPFELEIVEQTPYAPDGAASEQSEGDPGPDPAPRPDAGDRPAPRVIRIDEFGAHEVVPPEPATDPSGGLPDRARGGDDPLDEMRSGADHPDGDHPDGDHPDGDRADGATSIVIAHDDDVPDAVYIEGSLERDGSRSIVFIEDDDTGDTLAPGEERDVRRGIEPRLRERRVAVKRAEGRKRLKWIALGVGVVVVVVGFLAVLGSDLFAIREDQVTVTGAVYTDADRLQAVIDDLVGTPTLLADTDGAERALEAIPWVEAARVRTDFPHAVSIDIREREPMTTYQGPDQRFRVLDREGRVLDVIDGYPLAYLLLGGPDPVDLEPGDFAPAGYAAASEMTRNLTPSVRGRVEIIEVAADGSNLVMRLDDGTEVRFGEARDLFAKLVRLETVLTSGEEREPGVIDVSTDQVTF